MASKERANRTGRAAARQRPPRTNAPHTSREGEETGPGLRIQHGGPDPRLLTPQGVLQLQRMVGNQAVTRLLSGATQRRPASGPCSPAQAKLVVRPADDEYEREADRVAEQAMGVPQQVAGGLETKPRIQRIGTGSSQANDDFEQRLSASQGNGQALEPAVCRQLESRLGADFSQVRVHTGSESAALTRQIQAKAFTHGSDIHFGSGQYDPHSSAGQTLLAHELTHVVQQGAAGQSVIQRKVGFELESADWLAWKYEGKGTPTRERADEEGVRVRPVARQVEPLHVDPDYELQADDTFAPRPSNIEFVTEPFEVEANDLARLNGAFDRIEANVDTLERYSDRNRKAEAERDRYIFPVEHGLNQPGFLVSSDEGRKKTGFKMQATAGIRLSDVPQIMQYFARSVPGETELEKQHRGPAREFMKPNPILDVSLAQAPIWARQVLHEISIKWYIHHEWSPLGVHRGVQPANPFEANTGNLVGFLSTALAYLFNLNRATKSDALKVFQKLFARSDFAAMYGAVDPAQRQVLRAAPMLLVDAVVTVLRREAGLADLTRDAPVAGRAMVKEEDPDPEARGTTTTWTDVMQDVTVVRWLGGIARGGPDILSRGRIGEFLRSLAQGRGEKTDTAEFRKTVARHEQYLESVGINAPDISSGGDPLFLFENRGIINPTLRKEPNVNLKEARALAISYLAFFQQVEGITSGSFGQFPRR